MRKEIVSIAGAFLALVAAERALAQSATGVETAYVFTASSLGYQLPHGDLVKGADGSLYGTTVYGGDAGTGSVYKLTPDGVFARLHSFQATDATGANVAGAYPQAGVIFGNDGALYGATVYGGLNGTGTIFRLDLSAAAPALTTIHTFSSVDADGENAGGAEPYAALVLGLDGNFYGSTHAGGSGGNGTIFRITPGGQLNTLHEFSAYQESTINSDGAHPLYRLAMDAFGSLYGAVENGGAYGAGTIFRVTPQGSFVTLHSFGGTESEGREPSTVTVGPDGALYGTTESSGSATQGRGSIFRYSGSDGLQTLYAYSGFAGDGYRAYKRSALVAGSDGHFYGTAMGDDGLGIIYRFMPYQAFESLYVFGSVPEDLSIPDTTLAQGIDGMLYGTTSNGQGESTQNGGIFRFAPGMDGPVALEVAPSTIKAGETAQLTWSAPGFSYCSAYRSWTGLQGNEGTLVLAPTVPGTYQYQLSCYNQSGFGKGAKTVFLTVTPGEEPLPEPENESAIEQSEGGAFSLSALLLLVLVTGGQLAVSSAHVPRRCPQRQCRTAPHSRSRAEGAL